MSSIHCIDAELINSDQREYEFISKQIGKLQVRLFHSKIKVEAYFHEVNTHNSQASTYYSLLNGIYLLSDDPQEVIGDAVPDWRGSIMNTLRYKNFSLSFLIDIKKGGDVYSQDMAFGLLSGLYEETAGLNDLGNPIRNTLANGGGVILPGVKADGTPNDIRASFTNVNNPYGYNRAPEAMHVYDASFVKLRNVTLSYKLPKEMLGNTFIESLTLSVIGRNLWIIHKNLPYSDPEAIMGAGNAIGFQNGAHPTYREIGASVKVEF